MAHPSYEPPGGYPAYLDPELAAPPSDPAQQPGFTPYQPPAAPTSAEQYYAQPTSPAVPSQQHYAQPAAQHYAQPAAQHYAQPAGQQDYSATGQQYPQQHAASAQPTSPAQPYAQPQQYAQPTGQHYAQPAAQHYAQPTAHQDHTATGQHFPQQQAASAQQHYGQPAAQQLYAQPAAHQAGQQYPQQAASPQQQAQQHYAQPAAHQDHTATGQQYPQQHAASVQQQPQQHAASAQQQAQQHAASAQQQAQQHAASVQQHYGQPAGQQDHTATGQQYPQQQAQQHYAQPTSPAVPSQPVAQQQYVGQQQQYAAQQQQFAAQQQAALQAQYAAAQQVPGQGQAQQYDAYGLPIAPGQQHFPAGQPQQPAQQQYAQPQQQPAVPQPAPAAAPPQLPVQPPVKRKLGFLWASMVIVLVVCVAASVGGYLLYDKAVKPSTNANPAAGQIVVSTPESMGTRKKFSDVTIQSTLDGVRVRMDKVVPQSTNVVSSSYGNLKSEDVLLVLAYSVPVADPQAKLDEVFKSISANPTNLSEHAPIEPGPLGGKAKCAKLAGDPRSTAICGWADSGSIGIFVLYFKEVSVLKADFASLRGQIERRL